MNCRFLLIITCIFLNTCTAYNAHNDNSILVNKRPFINKGFALIYSDSLFQKKIITKKIEDSFASAANYINKIGWKKNQPCYFKVKLSDKVPFKFLNTSAKKIKNKKKLSFFKKYIVNYDDLNVNENLISALITPDKDIIPGANNLDPAYVVFGNYELILKWNRSLRFALATCKLKNKFSNEL